MPLIMERYNPWWFGEEDPAYAQCASSPIRWVPQEAEALSLKPFSLNFVVGPRQVGKTTLIKLLIHRLTSQVHPRSVFYYSCDELMDHRELGEVLDAYLSFKREQGLTLLISSWTRSHL